MSNVTGKLAGSEVRTAEYWVRHVREAVRFADGIATLHEQGAGVFLEIGPQPTLLGLVGQMGSGQVLLASLRGSQPDWQQMLMSLGELYVSGVEIDWEGVARNGEEAHGRRKVVLPTYPFQRQRYWIEVAGRTRGSGVLSPLLDKMVQLPAGNEVLFETAMSAVTLPFFRDHRVYETVVAPGACHLAMVLNAAAIALAGEEGRDQALHVKDVIFPQALVLGGDERRTAQIVLSPMGGADGEWERRFQLFSFAQAGPGAAPATTLHAQGVAGVCDGAVEGPALRELQARFTAAADVEALLAADASALVFGPAFQWLEAAWHAPESGSEVLTRLQRPGVVGSLDGYEIHPGLLDACFQTVGLLPSWAARGELLLPFAVAELQLMRAGGGASSGETWWCHTRQVGAEQWDLRLYDDAGQLAVAVQGFQLRAMPAAALQASGLRREWLYSLEWQAAPPGASVEPGILPDCWLVSGRTDGLCGELAATGRPVLRVGLDVPAAAMVAEIAASHRSVGVVYVGTPAGMTEQTSVVAQTYELCVGLLELTQALLGTELAAQLWVVTQGSQRPAAMTGITSAAGGALWGMARSIRVEQPKLRVVCIDLDRTPDEAGELVYREVMAGLREKTSPSVSEVAYAGGARYVGRVAPWRAAEVVDAQGPVRLQLEAYGALDQLAYVPLERRTPGAGEIEVAVKAVGLNFRDVLNGLGMLQEYYATVLGVTRAQDVGLGFECAGMVSAVGEGVTEVAVGDRVMGLSEEEGSFASYVTVAATQMVRIPEGMSDVEAATIPLALLTAWYGLVALAKLQRGERVLIHAAAGGVGQAAVQIAQAIGAEIIATASPSKWGFLREQGITHVLNSRTLEFVEDVRRITGGEGVAVVLNSLNGAYIDGSLAALGQGGRFVEIGKLGIWSLEAVAEVRPDVAYYAYDLGEATAADPTLYGRLWEAVGAELRAGRLHPLAQTVYPAVETVAAFRCMQQAKHVGKIVVSFVAPRAVELMAAGSYLVTGGLGALGLEIAQQLVAAGARQVVLAGRHGVTAAAQEEALRAMAEAGAEVTIVAADVADADEVRALLERCSAIAPLRGIVHVAGVLDDGVLTAQTAARLALVMHPKVDGAWHLHTQTQGMGLDFFVCFSSTSALQGSAGQGNYAAANGFMDVLMQQRRQQGLAGLSIGWGPWAEKGMAAGLEAQMAAHGQGMIAPQQGRQLFQYLLEHANETGGYIGVIPQKRTQHVARASSERSGKRDMRSILQELSAQDRLNRLTAYLRGEIAGVLGFRAPEMVDARTRLFDVGMDSLMAVELKNRIEAGLHCSVRATLLFDYPTVEVLAPYLLENVLKLVEAGAGSKPALPVRVARAETSEGAIAIVGMACHYPGEVDTPEVFWQQLLVGFDGIIDLPGQSSCGYAGAWGNADERCKLRAAWRFSGRCRRF